MTARQKAFVDEYLVDLNAAAAARRAGYSAKNAKFRASKLLRHSPEVAKAVAGKMEERTSRTGVTADYVLARIREVADRCMDEENFNPAGACRALELLGRHLGMFTDRVQAAAEISGPGGSPLAAAAAIVTVNLVRPGE